MFLKLTRRRAYDQAPSAALAPQPVVPESYASGASKRILERIRHAPGVRVLDLGVLSGESVTALAQAGAKVQVHDLVSPWRACLERGGGDIRELMSQVDVIPGSVDVICAWELLDLLPTADARWALERMVRWIVPKGWVMAVFSVDAVDSVHRFRLSDEGQVQVVRVGGLTRPLPVATNSDVSTLFQGFSLLSSALIRGQVREVLARSG